FRQATPSIRLSFSVATFDCGTARTSLNESNVLALVPFAQPVELYLARLGEAVLWRMVPVGQPQPIGVGEEGGGDDQAASGERDHLLQALRHQCRGRGPQQQDHVPQASRRRL